MKSGRAIIHYSGGLVSGLSFLALYLSAVPGPPVRPELLFLFLAAGMWGLLTLTLWSATKAQARWFSRVVKVLSAQPGSKMEPPAGPASHPPLRRPAARAQTPEAPGMRSP